MARFQPKLTLLKANRIITSPGTGTRYQVGKVLGEGGFGRTYRAFELNRRGQQVQEVCLKTTFDQASWHRESYFGELFRHSRRVIQLIDSFPLPQTTGGKNGILYCLVAVRLLHAGVHHDHVGLPGEEPGPVARRDQAGALGEPLPLRQLHQDLPGRRRRGQKDEGGLRWRARTISPRPGEGRRGRRPSGRRQARPQAGGAARRSQGARIQVHRQADAPRRRPRDRHRAGPLHPRHQAARPAHRQDPAFALRGGRGRLDRPRSGPGRARRPGRPEARRGEGSLRRPAGRGRGGGRRADGREGAGPDQGRVQDAARRRRLAAGPRRGRPAGPRRQAQRRNHQRVRARRRREGLPEAEVVFEGTYRTGFEVHHPTETHGSVAALLRAREHLVPQPDHRLGHGPAKYYRLERTGALVGFIGAMTNQHFCETCNRVRLTADGKIRPCLGNHGEVDLRAALRRNASNTQLAALLRQAVAQKPQEHALRGNYTPCRPMVAVGG